jgi:hypothetical protein
LLLDEAREELLLNLQRAAEVLPLPGERVGLEARELEIVNAAEEPQRNVPAQVVDQVVQQRLGRAAPGESCVDR